MASENVLPWILQHRHLIQEPVLEIGSRHYKEHSSLDLRRAACAGMADYTGCDLTEGDNVDLIADITAPAEEVRRAFGSRTYSTIFCISVLEHIPDVFSAARNISLLLRSGGILIISVPFVFRHHGYPGDYWRFTPEAVRHLFPAVRFDRTPGSSTLSTLRRGDVIPLPEEFKARNRFSYRPSSRWVQAIRKRLKPWGVSFDYSLAPTMVNMIGAKI